MERSTGPVEITLLAISVSKLTDQEAIQLELPLPPPDPWRPGSAPGAARWSLDRSMDAARARFGKSAVGCADGPGFVVNPVASDGLGDAGTFAPARGLPGRFDLLVGNLYAELHIALAHVYAARLLPDGEAVLTGILGRLAPSVEDALSAAGLRVTNRLERGEWALIEARVRA